VAIELSPREFSLLEYLARRAGDVVRRSEILDHVWAYDYDGMSNVVDVYIGYLRKKVEKPFGSRVIRAVRGVGYVLEDKA
jgi:two-component system OmpR family response regulator